MLIRFGHEFTVRCAQPTPMICLTAAHAERSGDLLAPEALSASQPIAQHSYHDLFGNVCRRFVAPAGEFTFGSDAILRDSGEPDDRPGPEAGDTPVAGLPDETLTYLLGSRYIETDLLSQPAWDMFARLRPGWDRVAAIADFVHGHVRFGYEHASVTRTAFGAFTERRGVCRDFAHLFIGFCRAMNIPARYVNGYLGDIGVPVAPFPMDFSAWTEVFVGGRWYTVDPRHNAARIGRIVVARGRDAADVPLIHSFGAHELTGFRVWTDELPSGTMPR